MANSLLTASARTCTAPPITPARISSNRASGAHSAVANVLETPDSPPQVTELSSVRRTWSPARAAIRTTRGTVPAIPGVPFQLRILEIVGYRGEPRWAQSEYG